MGMPEMGVWPGVGAEKKINGRDKIQQIREHGLRQQKIERN